MIGVSNPSTPDSALIDMTLLSECNAIAVTVGSSYGSVAAGLGGIIPIQMIHGHHKNVRVRAYAMSCCGMCCLGLPGGCPSSLLWSALLWLRFRLVKAALTLVLA